MLKIASIALLLAGSCALAAPPDPRTLARADVPPMPAPVPPGGEPAPGVLALAADEWHVIESDADLIVLASPEGVVKVTPEGAGPIRLKGKFAGGGGKVETRTFKGKSVFTVEALKSGPVELLLVPIGAKGAADVKRVGITARAQDPIPPPKPKPDEPVKPDPPTPGGELRVLFIAESSAKHAPEVTHTLNSTKVAAYLNARCAKGPGGHPEWRRYDPDTVFGAKESPTMRALFADSLAEAKRQGPAALVVAVGTDARVYPLAGMTEAEVLDLLRRAAGDK